MEKERCTGDQCTEHGDMMMSLGEIKGSLAALKESHNNGMSEIRGYVKDIYEKVNTTGVTNAEFKGRIGGGVAALVAAGTVAGAVGGWIIGLFRGGAH